MAYDPEELGEFMCENEPNLILDQRNVIEGITDAVLNKNGGIFSSDTLDGPRKYFFIV